MDPAERLRRDVGRRIAEVRRQLGLTQQEASEKLGMPLKNLQVYEAGKLDLRLSTLARLAQGLGVKPRDLLDRPVSRARVRPGRPTTTKL